MRCSASGVWPSKRKTSTGVVFDARTRPNPSSYSARSPSIVTISRAPGNVACARSCSITRTGSPSAQGTLSSGVLCAVGSASSTALGLALRDRISSSRAAV